MKIIQLNIWGGKLGFQIEDFLEAQEADFVCMQEVHDLEGTSGALFKTLGELQKAGGFSDVFMSPVYSFRYMERELGYGNAILSRQPFKSTRTEFTRGAYMRHFDHSVDDQNIRNLQISTVLVDGKPLHILNHHGHWIYGTKDGNEETLRQMKIIAEEIQKLDGPTILCGDFNLSPDSESLKVINHELTNLSKQHGLTRTYTHLSIIDEVCDYIFVNDEIKVNKFQKSEELVSDHNALILDFDI